MFVVSCGEKSIDHEDACKYFIELRDNPESEDSKELLDDYKTNIKNYSIDIITQFGGNESEMEESWDENEEENLNRYGQQYFLEVCQGKR